MSTLTYQCPDTLNLPGSPNTNALKFSNKTRQIQIKQLGIKHEPTLSFPFSGSGAILKTGSKKGWGSSASAIQTHCQTSHAAGKNSGCTGNRLGG